MSLIMLILHHMKKEMLNILHVLWVSRENGWWMQNEHCLRITTY
jgi:hypothetical protein